MPVDKSVIAALEAALENDKNNTALRLHLVSLLIENEQFEEALKHSQIVLNEESANVEALEKAADAAEKTGDLGKAESYRKLSRSLKPETGEKTVRQIRLRRYESDEWADFIEETPKEEKIRLREGFGEFGEEEEYLFESEMPDLRLEEVVGMEKVKRRLNLAFLAPLKNPEMRRLYSKSLRGGARHNLFFQFVLVFRHFSSTLGKTRQKKNSLARIKNVSQLFSQKEFILSF